MSVPLNGSHRVLSPRISKFLLSYYRGPNHPLKIRLWRNLMQALGYPRFTLKYHGAWITLDLRDWIQVEILKNGYFDPEVWEVLSQFIEKDEVIWDVGAHIGSVSLRAIPHPGVKKVLSFEPQPRTFSALEINLRLNPDKGQAFQLALNDRTGEIPFYEGMPGNPGLASFLPLWGQASSLVKCETVDRLVFENGLPPPTIIKIDAEGAELSILKGAAQVLNAHPPKAILFEADGKGLNAQFVEIAALLNAAGYQIKNATRLPVGLEEAAKESLANWIASR